MTSDALQQAGCRCFRKNGVRVCTECYVTDWSLRKTLGPGPVPSGWQRQPLHESLLFSSQRNETDHLFDVAPTCYLLRGAD